MTTDQTSTLVFKNAAGDYFLVPQATLEQGRVAEEHRAEVERLIATGDTVGDDVQGHALPLAIWFAGVVLEGAAIGFGAVWETGTLGPGLHR